MFLLIHQTLALLLDFQMAGVNTVTTLLEVGVSSRAFGFMRTATLL